MSTLCLFVLLGGTSYAALSITGRNVKDSSLTGKDVKNSSLTTSDLRDQSLLSKDFKAGQLPQGPQGPTGLTGASGSPGQTGPTGPPAASLLTGRFPEGANYASPSGTTATGANFTESEANMLSPSAPIVARDLSVRSDKNLSGNETVTLTVNGADTPLTCQIPQGPPGPPATCQDTTHAVTIPPGSTIAIHFQLTGSSGGGCCGIVRFGLRTTTP